MIKEIAEIDKSVTHIDYLHIFKLSKAEIRDAINQYLKNNHNLNIETYDDSTLNIKHDDWYNMSEFEYRLFKYKK